MPDIIVIADTSCLIALTKVNQLNILQSLYQTIIIPKEVASEFGSPLPEWVIIKKRKIQECKKY